jgi:hypothetical protein
LIDAGLTNSIGPDFQVQNKGAEQVVNANALFCYLTFFTGPSSFVTIPAFS